MKKLPVNEIKLSNGLTLLHLYTQQDPISACHLFLPGGTSQEQPSQLGLTTLRWTLLLKGTTTRNAKKLAEDIEMLGGSIGAGATHDYSEVSCHSASVYFSSVLKIMAEVLFHPLFKQEEVSKEREALVAAIRSKKESIYSTASEQLNQHLYHNHPYARPNSGVEKTVSKLTADDLHLWNKTALSPNGAILVIATDIPFVKMKKVVFDLFGPSAWSNAKGPSLTKIRQTKAPERASTTRLHEKFEQAYLMMGFPTGGIHSKNYLAVKVLNAALGGGMSTRLFQELREKEGLAYDVGSYYASKLYGSAFVIHMGLQASNLEKARKRIEEILLDVKENGIPEDELRLVKNYLKGTYLLDHQTNSQRAHYLGWWKILGKPTTFDRDYIQKINNVTAKHVRETARELYKKKPIVVEIQPQNAMPRSIKESLSIA